MPVALLPSLPYLEVLNSFAIRRSQQFFLIGTLHGSAEPGMFACIQLNRSLELTLRIKAIAEVEFPRESRSYTLLELHGDDDPDSLTLLLGLNVGPEIVPISPTGQD